MKDQLNKNQFIYDDIRLKMGFAERLIARLLIFVFYISLTLIAFLLVLTKESNIKYLGYLFILFLIDRVLFVNAPPKAISKHFLKSLRKGEVANLSNYALDSFKRFLEVAMEKTLIGGSNFYLRLLDEFLSLKEFQKVFIKLDIKPSEFRYHLQEALKGCQITKRIKGELVQTASFLAIDSLAYCDSTHLKPKDLFTALFFIQDPELSKLMTHFKINPEDIKVAVIFTVFHKKFFGLKIIPATLSSFVKKTPNQRHKVMNRAWTARPTPYLDSVSTDLTDLAREEKIGFLIGHEEEYKRIIDVLSRHTKNNVLLVGEPGSGKDTMVMHLAYQVSHDDVPSELFDKRVVMLSISELVAGGQPNEVIDRAHKIVNEILSAGNVILYIPDIHNLTRTSGEQFLSMADAFVPVLNRSDFQVVGACAPQDFKRDIETRSDFVATFEMVRVEEISEEDAIKLLSYVALILENQYKIDITFKAIKQSVKICRRYFRDKLLPSSAEELLKETLADVKNRGENVLNEEDIINVSQAKLNIPLKETTTEEAEILLNLEEKIHQRLIDQEPAVKAVSQALREYRAGLSRKSGPIATFLFVGPTGVGKTELAKILTKIHFGSEANMVRFDMSEYQDKKTIFRFIGAPDDSSAVGSLTESIRQKPYSLILLDEFEKAHPDILNVFLSVFDDGRLTDNLGRVIDFSNTIIIATSNAHSDVIKDELERGVKISEITKDVKKRLTDYFRPELLNRFSDIIVFKTLSPEDLKKIATILLKEITDILAEKQAVNISFDDSAVNQLVNIGYSPIYGARPLRNAISENIKSLLSEKILKKEFNCGDCVVLKFNGQEFIIEKAL